MKRPQRRFSPKGAEQVRERSWLAECRSLACSVTVYARTKKDVVARWNTRTAYNPNERLSEEVEELKHDVERQMSIANAECNEVERLREALELVVSHERATGTAGEKLASAIGIAREALVVFAALSHKE